MNYTTGNNWPDKQLVAKVLNGDTQSFATIVKNTEGLVAKIVFQMISNIEDRRDIAQDIYLKAFSNLAGFRFQSKLSTWIGQIAYNTCLNYLDKKKLVLAGNLSEEHAEDEEVILNGWSYQEDILAGRVREEPIMIKERAAILQTAVQALPPLYKTLVLLFHQEEMSYEEISQITALPAGTVKSYLYRARKSLRDHLLTRYQKEEI